VIWHFRRYEGKQVLLGSLGAAVFEQSAQHGKVGENGTL
jgi:hypothetical protein